VVVCLKQGAYDLHMVQLMSLPPHHILLRWLVGWSLMSLFSTNMAMSEMSLASLKWFYFPGASLPGLSWKRDC